MLAEVFHFIFDCEIFILFPGHDFLIIIYKELMPVIPLLYNAIFILILKIDKTIEFTFMIRRAFSM